MVATPYKIAGTVDSAVDATELICHAKRER